MQPLRFGIFCFLGRGHLDPMTALGRGLTARGHHATVFHLLTAQVAVRAARLNFQPIDRDEPPTKTGRHIASRFVHAIDTLEAVRAHAERTLREGVDAVRRARVDALLIDQMDLAAGTVADMLGLPYITVCCAPPTYLDAAIPPPYFGWGQATSRLARYRNQIGNAVIRRGTRSVMRLINEHRARWDLPLLDTVDDTFSKVAIITQMPEALEFRKVGPVREVLHCGQFRDNVRTHVLPFPWHRLDGRPLVYGSMGTIRNRDSKVFRMMAAACAEFELQLVLSLGGGPLLPDDLGPLPGNPIVVHYAPQAELLERAVMTLQPAGLNTSLEAIRHGVPIVAIPVAEDQPGVAARLARAGAGIVIPYRRVTTARLTRAIRAVLEERRYRDAVAAVRTATAGIDGVARAVEIIESRLAPLVKSGSFDLKVAN